MYNMYLCLDCDNIFEYPVRYIESHGLDSPPYEEWYGCPKCAGAYVKTMPCSCCNNWITSEYIELNEGTVICDRCYKVKNIDDAV